MSDPEVTPPAVPEESSPEPPKPASNPILRTFGLGIVGILVLFMVWFAGILNASAVRQQTLLHGLNALAYASKDAVLTGDAAKLRVLAQGIADSGDYTSVTFTNAQGIVLASTDTTQLGKTLDQLKNPPLTSKLQNLNGHDTMFRAITLGENNVIGGISIELKSQ